MAALEVLSVGAEHFDYLLKHAGGRPLRCCRLLMPHSKDQLPGIGGHKLCVWCSQSVVQFTAASRMRKVYDRLQSQHL